MDIREAIKSRHSVRDFTDKKIESETEKILRQTIHETNQESGLNFQLLLNEPNAFRSKISTYGRFNNCKNYIALAGPKGTDEKYGYYGEKIVLKAQQLGLNSCWVGLTCNKSQIPCTINKEEKIRLVIALGYGVTQGKPRTSKALKRLSKIEGETGKGMPVWFKAGMEAAMLAPTAINQQKFLMILNNNDNIVTAKALPAFYSKIDLGIVKYHFEIGAGTQNFRWG